MRTFKTPKKKRTNYTYQTTTGLKITLTPNDVGEDWITILHELDDAMVDEERRELYHVPIRYDAYLNGEDYDSDKADWLIDPSPDVLESMIEAIDLEKHKVTLKRLRKAVSTLQPQQIELLQKVFFQKRTKVDIAAEEGVSEAAIRHRLNRIYAVIQKKLIT